MAGDTYTGTCPPILLTCPVDVIVVGAGPTGLACAIEVQKVGFRVKTIEKGCVVNSLYKYPTNLTFFTTPELLEIGDIPMTAVREKPTRGEAPEVLPARRQPLPPRHQPIRAGQCPQRP